MVSEWWPPYGSRLSYGRNASGRKGRERYRRRSVMVFATYVFLFFI
jgi:hypothetical protein